MSGLSTSRLREVLSQAVGPTPWYWKTFPRFRSPGGQQFVWTHHGDQGPLGYVVTLGLEQEPDQPRLALNSYCRPFLVSSQLGIWCPEGRSLRVTCFDPENLKSFELGEVAGWFKQSSDRIYAATAPLADFEIPPGLAAGTHSIEVPEPLRGVDELIIPTSYPTKTAEDPAFALYVVYLGAGLVEVLPQNWFTSSQYQIGKQWITRATRDPESHRIVGEFFGVGEFVLRDGGCKLERWLDRDGP